MTKVNVIDAVMGAGKTEYIIRMIRETHKQEKWDHEMPDIIGGAAFPDGKVDTSKWKHGLPPQPRKWLIVVPFKGEVKRFKDALPTMYLHDPEPVHGRKLYHLAILIKEGLNVACTHALFELLTKEIYEDLRRQNYTLVIDETLDCVDEFGGLDKYEGKTLIDDQWVSVEEKTNRLIWNSEKRGDYEGKRFSDIKSLCETGSLVLVNETMLLWEFPIEFIKCFDEIWLCTYMFMGSPFFSYLMSYDVDINFLTINSKGECVPWLGSGSDETALKAKFRSLINLYEGGTAANLGQVGRTGKENPYSMAWFRRQGDDTFKMIKNSTGYFFGHISKTSPNENGWTVWKEFKAKCQGQGFTKTHNPYQETETSTKRVPIPSEPGKAYGFIPANAKGSNNWMNIQSMAYLCNTFYHTVIRHYFLQKEIPVYDELYALSEMIQWIWRSQIRNDKPINLYIPSERMRSLFKMWLDSGSLKELLCEKLYPHDQCLKLLFTPDAAVEKDAA